MVESNYVALRPRGGRGVIRAPEGRALDGTAGPLPLTITAGDYACDEVVFAVRCGASVAQREKAGSVVRGNPTLFQFGKTHFLSAGLDPADPVVLRRMPKISTTGVSLCPPTVTSPLSDHTPPPLGATTPCSKQRRSPSLNPLTFDLEMLPKDDPAADDESVCSVLSRVWDVRYEGRGTVGLRSAAHPNYWLARDPVTNTLRLLPEEARTDHSRSKLYSL